jgi:hypothetical protein
MMFLSVSWLLTLYVFNTIIGLILVHLSLHHSDLAISFMPNYTSMPFDDSGRILYEKNHLTSMVEKRHLWLTRLGSIDTITLTTLEGKLVMPKSQFPAKHSRKNNHPSWNLIAKHALGSSLASWISQGIVEVGIPGY